MSKRTENTHNVHLRKQRLLNYLNDDPELNIDGLNQQNASAIEEMMITDTESFASFHNPPPTTENVTAFSNVNFNQISCNVGHESHPGIIVKIDKNELKKFEKYVIHMENGWRTKTLNLMKLVQNTTHKSRTSHSDIDESASLVSPEEKINFTKNIFETSNIQLVNPETENVSIPSTSKAEYQPQMKITNRFQADENGTVCIGPNGTMVPRRTLESINWSLTGTAVTRKILVEIFGRETLSDHNLSGKPSPAFGGCNKKVKGQLDPAIVADIIHLMQEQKGLTPKEVRKAIITKCADENKMLRLKGRKRQSIAAQNQRNIFN